MQRVARAAKWLPTSDDSNHNYHLKKAKIGDFTDVVRGVRNFAHPARYRKDHSGKKITARYLRQQFAVVEIRSTVRFGIRLPGTLDSVVGVCNSR